MMSFNATQMLRKFADCAHHLLTRSYILAGWYLLGCRYIAPFLPPHRRNQMLNSLSSVVWPQRALKAVPVVVGNHTWINLTPHNGEFDFKAVLGGNLQYEDEVFRFLDQRMNLYSAVIEIGANVGVFSLYFAAQLRQQGGKAYSFEPSRTAFARLLENSRLNGLTNLECFNAAVSDKSGIVAFHEPEGHLTNGSLLPEFAAHFNDIVASRSVLTLAAEQLEVLLVGQRRVLLKVDVEGYEPFLIRALAPLIEKYQPDLLMEVLPDYEDAIEDAIRTVAPSYSRYAITSGGLKAQARLHAEGGRDCFLCPTRMEPAPQG